MARWHDVRAWLRDLATAPLPSLHLSPAGAILARDVALAPLTDEVLDRVAALPGRPFERARFIAARTVCTAPLEWLAVLLGRGTRVQLQLPTAPSDTARLWAAWAEFARARGLPLSLVGRGEGSDAPLVVAMGGDDTVASLAAELPSETRFLGFGARYSAAVCESLDDVDAIVSDLVLHDGRGCMSPGLVLVPNAGWVDAFSASLEAAEARWPRGHVSDAEHAAIRSRGALARVVGQGAAGEGWAVHALPWAQRSVASLPRAPLLTTPADLDAAIAALAADPQLSTLGTRRSVRATGGGRVVPPGTQQRPPVERCHDGIDWLVATLVPDPAILARGDSPDTEAT